MKCHLSVVGFIRLSGCLPKNVVFLFHLQCDPWLSFINHGTGEIYDLVCDLWASCPTNVYSDEKSENLFYHCLHYYSILNDIIANIFTGSINNPYTLYKTL